MLYFYQEKTEARGKGGFQMGAWNASITGNDTAQDLKSEYQAAFFYNDVDIALEKLDRYVRNDFDESDEEEWCNYYYSLADFMWKHGILTEEVRSRTISMIDSGFGLEIWEGSGEKVLRKRKKVLSEFREKIASPQPPKKKIRVDMYLDPIFETGDIIAIQLQTEDKAYLDKSCFCEDFFRACNGKYVVLRKVTDQISYRSGVEPKVRDLWAVFQLYGKIFNDCPTMEEIKGIPLANTAKHMQSSDICAEAKGTFVCESSMFYFKKRKYQLIGKDLNGMPEMYYRYNFLFFAINKPWYNVDAKLLDAIWD